MLAGSPVLTGIISAYGLLGLLQDLSSPEVLLRRSHGGGFSVSFQVPPLNFALNHDFVDINLPLCAVAFVIVALALDLPTPREKFWLKFSKIDWM